MRVTRNIRKFEKYNLYVFVRDMRVYEGYEND